MHAGAAMIWISSVLDSMFHWISISCPVDNLYLLCYEFLMSLYSAPPLALSGRFSALSSCHFRRRQEAYPMDIISLYIYDLLCNLVHVYLYIASWKSLLEITFWIWFWYKFLIINIAFLESSVPGWWSGRRRPSSAGWYVSFLIELLLSLTAKSTVKQ